MTLEEFIRIAEPRLIPLSSRFPSHTLLKILMEDVMQIPYLFRLTDPQKNLTAQQEAKGMEALHRICAGEPPQYVAEKAWFYGWCFYVNPFVLIPRQETEELVRWVLETCADPQIRVMDIGTGSGCILISLLKAKPEAHGWGIDVSSQALLCAKKNALQLLDYNTMVHFFEMDFLNNQPDMGFPLDLIVSNPPYIAFEKAKEQVDDMVYYHEPHLALFPPGNDPYIFYRKIISWAEKGGLKKNGWLFFEIESGTANEVMKLFHSDFWKICESRQDINGHERMIRAQKD